MQGTPQGVPDRSKVGLPCCVLQEPAKIQTVHFRQAFDIGKTIREQFSDTKMRLELVLPQLVVLLAVPGAEHSTVAINPPVNSSGCPLNSTAVRAYEHPQENQDVALM